MDYSNSCRFCLNPVDILERIHLTRTMKKQYNDLTLTQLIRTKYHPNFCCLECRNKLNTCIEIKKQFVQNQTILNKSIKTTKKRIASMNIKKEEEEILVVPKLEDLQDMSFLNTIIIKEEPCYESVKTENLTEILEVPAVSNISSLPIQTSNSNKRSFECDVCGRIFFLKNLILMHLKRHFNIRDVPCTQCGKLFVAKRLMTEHYKVVHKGLKHITIIHCELCGKICQSKTYFDNHVRSAHTGEKPFHCDINNCKKSFYTQSDLQKHRKFFHAEPVECPICKAKVKRIKQHMRCSHNERKWICDFVVDGTACEKKYESKNKLQTHIEVAHRGIRKFSCNQCSSVFSKPIHLDNHRRNVHENRRIKCELCSTLVTKKEYYRRHIILHHKDLDEMTKSNLLAKIKNTTYEDLFNHTL